MLEETRESKLAAAKKKIQDILKVLVSNLHHSSGGLRAPLSADTAPTHPSPNDCSLYFSPQSSFNSSSLRAPQSRYKELEVALDSSSTTINQLNENIESLTLKEEKKRDIHRIQELERSLSEIKPQMAQPPSPVPPAGPSDVEQLQDEAKHLRKEVESLVEKLQSQVENNQALNLLNKEQKERLQEQEERLREQEERLREQEERRLREQERLCEQKERLEEQGERLRKQEERLRMEEERLQKQEKRLWDQEERLWEKEERLRKQEERLRMQERLALSQNQKLDKQLAEPQCGFEDLNNENKSALQLKQQVKELQEKLSEEHLEAASQQNQHLEAQLSLMALPGEGNEGEHLDGEEEEAPQLMPSIPKDLESQEAMRSFMDLPNEKADGKEQVEKLELGFIQLSGAREGMRDYITEYESHGAVPNTRHQEDIIKLAQKEEEMKVKLLELQKPVLLLMGHHEGHDKFLPTAQNPAEEPAPGAPAPQELGAAEEQGGE
ncbi:PREDICTED: putative golgin subfamily A member 6B [Cercocebus atys]|uniref:putative golgin subfamily A member 6B n=1 Tax=Cercocebus atys TaxID=9531 RepID=UPI0005F4037D|nr:PREDICTED: putative golgin subfamily A member 6B [Cercocebus atys]